MTDQHPTPTNRAELEAALRELITYADLMPKKTPAAGSCVTEHQFTITAGAIWGLDERVQKAKSVLAALSSPPSDQERGLEEARKHVMPGDPEHLMQTALQWYLNFNFGYPHSARESNIAVEGFKDGYRAALTPPPTVEHATPQAEPVAWMYELAYTRKANGEYEEWMPGISRVKPCVPANSIRNLTPLFAALSPSSSTEERWPLGTAVRKKKGSSWNGRVVGYYSTTLTPFGYAVESDRELGSVQIYPQSALERGEAR